MRDRLHVARRSLHAHDISFLSGRRRHQRCQQRAPVTAAALAELESREPQLIAAFRRPFANQRAEEREVADMGGLKHEGLRGAVCKTEQGQEYRMRTSWRCRSYRRSLERDKRCRRDIMSRSSGFMLRENSVGARKI